MQASRFLEKLAKLTLKDLTSIKGVGEVIAKNYVDFFASVRFQQILSKFRELEAKNLGLEIRTTLVDKSNLPLFSEIICITGTFEKPRSQLKKQLEDLGAVVVDSITSETTILLAGEKSGSKLVKAKEKNIRIITNLQELV